MTRIVALLDVAVPSRHVLVDRIGDDFLCHNDRKPVLEQLVTILEIFEGTQKILFSIGAIIRENRCIFAVFVLDVRQPVSCVVDVFRIKRDLSGRESVTELELHGMVEEQVSRASTQTLQRLTKAFLREVLMQAGSDL